jgi:hypothetical protein
MLNISFKNEFWSREYASAPEMDKTIEDLDKVNGKDGDILRNKGFEGYPSSLAHHPEPSQPSQPSPIPIEISSEEEKAAKLKEYERLSALSRKNSKATARIQPDKNDLS